MQLKFFHDVKCIIFIIEVLLLSPFINNFFGIILTYPTNHDILYHKSHWTCRLIANLLQKWLVITVRPTTSVRESPQKNLPPRNTPDLFCRRFTRQNHRCAAWAVFFFFTNKILCSCTNLRKSFWVVDCTTSKCYYCVWKKQDVVSALRPAFFIPNLESFISRLNVISCHDLTLSVGEPDNAAAKQGQELRSG